MWFFYSDFLPYAFVHGYVGCVWHITIRSKLVYFLLLQQTTMIELRHEYDRMCMFTLKLYRHSQEKESEQFKQQIQLILLTFHLHPVLAMLSRQCYNICYDYSQ